MSQSKILQEIICSLRDDEIKMSQGDHIGFGMFYALVFAAATWGLSDGAITVYYSVVLFFVLVVPIYYYLVRRNARKSWHREDLRRELEGKDLPTMWKTCDDGDWLLWFTAHMVGKPGWPTHQQIVFAACQCARIALKYQNSENKGALKAIEAAEGWTDGRVSVEEVIIAGQNASVSQRSDSAFCAVKAAEGVTWSVHAQEDGGGFRFAQAVSEAACYTTWAAEYFVSEKSGHSGRAAAKKSGKMASRECAQVVRRELTVPEKIGDKLPIYSWVTRWRRNSEHKKTGKLVLREFQCRGFEF